MRLPGSVIVICAILAGLGFFIGWRPYTPGSVHPSEPLSVAVTALPAPAPLPIQKANGTTNPGAPSAATNTFDWRQVESPDYRKYIANLRAIGCPAETVADIVTADVAKLYDERIRAVRERFGAFPYWRTETPAAHWTADLQAAIRQLRHEQHQVLQELLGPLPASPALAAAEEETDPRLAFLSTPRQRQLVEIQRRFDQRLAQLLAGLEKSSSDNPLEDLRQEREAALNELLSPTERDEYEVRASPAADSIRAALDGVSVSESEFREIVHLQRQFLQEHPDDPFLFLNSDRQRARDQAHDRLKEEIQNILGPDRYPQAKFDR